jgi:hypothetical protein
MIGLLLLALLPGPKPRPVAHPTAVTAVVVPVLAADTLVSTVRWTNPADDGKGPLDSLKVNVTSLAGGWVSQKFTGTLLPSQVIVRQALPFQDATWTILAQICTYRGTSANAAACVSASAVPFVYALAAPPAVTGASVTNVKVP